MMARRSLLALVTALALGAPLLRPTPAQACEPGVCFRDPVGDEVTERPLQAPIFVAYDATGGSVPSAAEFVASGGGDDVAALVEVFPSGQATEVRDHVAMVLPAAPLIAGTSYTMRLTAEVIACSEFAEFTFTAQATSLPEAPAMALAAADLASAPLAPNPASDCSDQDALATSFSVSPQAAGDGAALYALRVRDTYPDDDARSVYPELTIVDVRAELPLRYDAVTDEAAATPREVCFVAAAISGEGAFGADSQEVCVTLQPNGNPPTPCAPGESCEASGCGCAANPAADGGRLASLMVGVVIGLLGLGWPRRRQRRP